MRYENEGLQVFAFQTGSIGKASLHLSIMWRDFNSGLCEKNLIFIIISSNMQESAPRRARKARMALDFDDDQYQTAWKCLELRACNRRKKAIQRQLWQQQALFYLEKSFQKMCVWLWKIQDYTAFKAVFSLDDSANSRRTYVTKKVKTWFQLQALRNPAYEVDYGVAAWAKTLLKGKKKKKGSKPHCTKDGSDTPSRAMEHGSESLGTGGRGKKRYVETWRWWWGE